MNLSCFNTFQAPRVTSQVFDLWYPDFPLWSLSIRRDGGHRWADFPSAAGLGEGTAELGCGHAGDTTGRTADCPSADTLSCVPCKCAPVGHTDLLTLSLVWAKPKQARRGLLCTSRWTH